MPEIVNEMPEPKRGKTCNYDAFMDGRVYFFSTAEIKDSKVSPEKFASRLRGAANNRGLLSTIAIRDDGIYFRVTGPNRRGVKA